MGWNKCETCGLKTENPQMHNAIYHREASQPESQPDDLVVLQDFLSVEEFRRFLDIAEQAYNGKSLSAPRAALKNAIDYYREKGL